MTRSYFDKTEGRGSLTAYKLFLSSHRVEVILDHESMMPWLTYDWFILYACHSTFVILNPCHKLIITRAQTVQGAFITRFGFPLNFLFPKFVPVFYYGYAQILPPIQTTLPRVCDLESE
ncbi:hypothetical protein VNO77_44511 [Canavalia gladiata]|uniref:Uncharacterized protein n=1 Tax=Canavalia gladiata TaxID=3824 RepID=A0AAN9JZ32_CANGL